MMAVFLFRFWQKSLPSLRTVTG